MANIFNLVSLETFRVHGSLFLTTTKIQTINNQNADTIMGNWANYAHGLSPVNRKES